MRNQPPPARSRLASPLTALALAAVLAAGPGCEPRDTGVSAELEEAIELVQLASRGYVPADYADQYDAVDIEAFRQATLAEARPHLETAMRSGTTDEQVTARQMLADIHASAARSQARDAQAAATRLAADTSNLATKLRNLEQLHHRLELLQQDRAAVQRELTEETEQQRQRQQALEGQREALASELAELTEQRDNHRRDARTADDEAHALREQAFTLEGDEHYDRLDEAAQAERRAAEADVEADQLEALIERRESERATAEAELEEIASVLEGLADQLDKWEQRERSRREQVEQLQSDHIEAAEALLERFERATAHYQQQVHAPFTEAGRHLAEAVELLDAAVGQAPRERRATVQRDLLVQRVAHVQLLTDHVMATGSIGRSLAPLARRGPGAMPETLDADRLRQTYRELVDQQQQVILDGIGGAQAGQSLASELGNVADEQLQRFSDRQRTNLARYIERLNEHALD